MGDFTCKKFLKSNEELQRKLSTRTLKSKMSFSNVPVKNPGRYLEQFVKIVQPRGGECLNKAIPAVQSVGMGSGQSQTWSGSKEMAKMGDPGGWGKTTPGCWKQQC